MKLSIWWPTYGNSIRMGGASSRMGGATSFAYPALPWRFKSLLKATAVKGNIKTEGLAKVQDPCDPKNLGWANHPAFPFPCTINYDLSIDGTLTWVPLKHGKKLNLINFSYYNNQEKYVN